MKWTVLSDNRTNDNRLETEHGLSILLETEHHRILLDTGASDVFIRNAEKMGIDLSMVDYMRNKYKRQCLIKLLSQRCLSWQHS